MPLLETERLTVRELTMNDFKDVHRILNEAFETNMPHEKRADWLRWTTMGYTQFSDLGQPPLGERGFALKDTGELIGLIGVVPYIFPFGQFPYFGSTDGLNSAKIGLFWATDPRQHGHGYATEAARAVIEYLFTQERLDQIIATTEYDNPASQAVMRKLGMTVQRNPFDGPPWAQVLGILENPNP